MEGDCDTDGDCVPLEDGDTVDEGLKLWVFEIGDCDWLGVADVEGDDVDVVLEVIESDALCVRD